MKNCLTNKRFLNIFLLVFLVGFLILPKICLAEEFEDVKLEELGNYLELPEQDVNKLMETLKQVFTKEGVLLWGSGDATDEKIAVAITLLKVVKMQALSHLLVDAPLGVAWGIVNNAVKIARLMGAKDISVILDELEKESIKMATEYGINFLLQNEIRVTPGVIKFKYYSYKGREKEIILQYVMIYKPDRNNKRAEIRIRFYMPNPIEAPEAQKYNKGITTLPLPDLKKDLSPFIVEINGIIEKTQYDYFRWIDKKGNLTHPSINIDFPPKVPDLGIKPLTFWEKNFLQPIKTTIGEVEVIITKVTGGTNLVENISQIATDIWNTIKSTVSELNPFTPAAIVQPFPPTTPEEVEKIKEETDVLEEKIAEIKTGEIKPPLSEVVEVKPKQPLTLEEIQERLDDIAERIDVLSQKMVELAEEKGIKVALMEETEETSAEEEEVEEEAEVEEVEEGQLEGVGQELCQKVPGSYPSQNKIIINEVAWMGTVNSPNDEWIELKNISGQEINLAGWQLLDKDQQIKIIFDNQHRVLVNGFWLLERTADESVPGIKADLIYTGALRNENEALYLFDENCQLQDEVIANSNWPAGDNISKRTMERRNILSWQTSLNPGGTPKAENSSGYIEIPVYYGGGSTPPPTPPSYPKILISEIQIASETTEKDDFVELYNPNSEDVDLTNWYIQRKTKGAQEFSSYAPKSLFSGKKILAQNYFLIANASSSFLIIADATSTYPLTEDNTLVLKNPGREIVDKVGWGEAQDFETATTTNPQPGKSIGRKWSSTTESYIDIDNNFEDFEIQNPTPKAQNQSPTPPQNQIPIAQFIFTPQNPFVGEEVLFDASSSTDPDGQIASFSWDFGDGNLTTTTQATTTYFFFTSGDFLVTLIVIDDNGTTSSPATSTINISTKPKVLINEVQTADNEFVELYNFGTTTVNMTGWYFSYFSSEKDWNEPWRNWRFPDGANILAQSYYLIGIFNFPESGGNPNADWQVKTQEGNPYSQGQLSENGAVAIFPFNPREKSSAEAQAGRIDALGWSQTLVKEGNSATSSPENQSLERINKNIDTDDNSADFKINSYSTPTNSAGQMKFFWQGAEGENGVNSLILVGDYLYAGLRTIPAKVIKIDLSNGSTLATWTATSTDIQYAQSLTFDGNYLYVGTGNYPARIIKIDPAKMETLELIWEGNPNQDGSVNALVSVGNYIYGGLIQSTAPAKVIKIDPTATTTVTFWQASGPGISSIVRDLIFDGQYLYAAGPRRGGVHKIDPITMTTYSTSSFPGYWEKNAAFGLAFDNNFIYATLDTAGLVKINPTTMQEEATSTLEIIFPWWYLIEGGGYLYASAHLSPFKVVKINPSTLTIEEMWQGSEIDNLAPALVFVNDYLYIGLANSPAKIIKINVNE